MGLIKKSVSDIERKVKYARYVMRVLKECHMVQDFMGYTKSENYKNFKKRYIQRHKDCSEIWYDYDTCGDIFGTVNFSNFYFNKHMKEPYNSYALLIAYIALFDEEEYNRYGKCYSQEYSPNQFIVKFLEGRIYETNSRDIGMLKKWIKHKEALYGSKDCSE